MNVVTSLTITYDSECGLCSSARDWILRQSPAVGIEFLPMGSPEARRRFPQLKADELVVVANTGEVWLGDHAWIACLWALRDYRDLAFRLTSPLLSGMARQAFSVVSKHRLALSGLLGFTGDRELQAQLLNVNVPHCEVKACQTEKK